MTEFQLTEDTKHIRNAKYIPITLQDRVCMCVEPGSPLFNYDKRLGPLVQCCKTCRKPYRWNVRHCTMCGAWFIKDFRKKSKDCVKHGRCWECLNVDIVCACDKEDTIRPDFGPLGLNPKVYSQEEMDAAFDMPSVFD